MAVHVLFLILGGLYLAFSALILVLQIREDYKIDRLRKEAQTNKTETVQLKAITTTSSQDELK